MTPENAQIMAVVPQLSLEIFRYAHTVSWIPKPNDGNVAGCTIFLNFDNESVGSEFLNAAAGAVDQRWWCEIS